MENMVKLGPNEMRGSKWDEGGKSEIQQIIISHQKNTINSIQFAYAEYGGPRLSEIHGEPTGLKFDIVTLHYPQERLLAVSGQYDNNGILVSIAFHTEFRRYGFFGGSNYNPHSGLEEFKYNLGGRLGFGGFHGSVNNSCVSAIGVYVNPLRGVDIWDDDILEDY